MYVYDKSMYYMQFISCFILFIIQIPVMSDNYYNEIDLCLKIATSPL